MMQIAREFFNLPEQEQLKNYSDDPTKTTRLFTSFNIRTEKVANWRDYLGLHCYPIDNFIDEWPTNPASFRAM
ncbi:putative flavanone 3-dioxygenase [Helianthus anomalus]